MDIARDIKLLPGYTFVMSTFTLLAMYTGIRVCFLYFLSLSGTIPFQIFIVLPL